MLRNNTYTNFTKWTKSQKKNPRINIFLLEIW